MEIKPGLKGASTLTVKDGNTAIDFGSGKVPVLATPMLIALMENAAINAVEKLLPDGQATVGTLIECRHLAATPKGMTVTAKAELIELDKRRLIFHVEAFDEKEKVGDGKHERFIVDLHKFLKRCLDKQG